MTGRDVDDSMGTGSGEGDTTRGVEAALRRALNEPVSPGELAGWDAAAASYRSAVRQRPVRRLRVVACLPLSAAAAVSVLLPAGAVAAAYTGRLPAHVQHWAHRALAPIGVPSHRRSAPEHRQRQSSPSPVPSPSPYSHLVHRAGVAALPPREHTRAVHLCVVLSRTPREKQHPVLTALQRLLPQERNLHQTCHTLLVSRGRPHPTVAHPTPSPSPRGSASPAPVTNRTPAPTATPSPRASSPI